MFPFFIFELFNNGKVIFFFFRTKKEIIVKFNFVEQIITEFKAEKQTKQYHFS